MTPKPAGTSTDVGAETGVVGTTLSVFAEPEVHENSATNKLANASRVTDPSVIALKAT